MKWWTYPVQWFGRRERKIGTVKDGRTIRVWTRSIGKHMLVTQVDTICSKCGEWLLPDDDTVNTQDQLGSTRNEHRQCPVSNG